VETINLQNKKTNFQSREAIFLYYLFDNLPVPQNPIAAIMVGQFKKLVSLIDENPEYQKIVANLFHKIKEEW
jgi:hypothetical protein